LKESKYYNKEGLISTLKDSVIDSLSQFSFPSLSRLAWHEGWLIAIFLYILAFVFMLFVYFSFFCCGMLIELLAKPFCRKPKERPKPQEEEA
jgi:hypothetical protein